MVVVATHPSRLSAICPSGKKFSVLSNFHNTFPFPPLARRVLRVLPIDLARTSVSLVCQNVDFFCDKKKLHFEAALKIDPRCRRNHYCRALVALAKGDSKQAEASFKQAVRCSPTSPEEEDVGEFFLRESRSALRALETRSRDGVSQGKRVTK